ncbi:MAG: sigma-70 family RNA polymerase sigma factor [Flavobacterium sp.]|nr:MAG: sigma-70 family RNA polymerase sigma factor [Flavobacterium sp.]
MKTDVNIENESYLFALLKQGDEAAFEKIYKRYWTGLYQAAYKRLPEKEKCQDIIQNIFVDLWTRRADLTIDNPTAYLHTAVRFQILKQITRNPKNSFISSQFEKELISPLASDHVVLEKEVKSLVELYIAALPEKRKNIFLMHYYEGLSTANIAIQLNVSRKTVQNQLTTASHGLRFKLTHMFLWLLFIYFL